MVLPWYVIRHGSIIRKEIDQMIKGARYGKIMDTVFLFTHYDPINHRAWTDDIYNKDEKQYGYWIPYDLIKWC